jgi:hypothetical protein
MMMMCRMQGYATVGYGYSYVVVAARYCRGRRRIVVVWTKKLALQGEEEGWSDRLCDSQRATFARLFTYFLAQTCRSEVFPGFSF